MEALFTWEIWAYHKETVYFAGYLDQKVKTILNYELEVLIY